MTVPSAEVTVLMSWPQVVEAAGQPYDNRSGRDRNAVRGPGWLPAALVGVATTTSGTPLTYHYRRQAAGRW
jgi:hypothetical protein